MAKAAEHEGMIYLCGSHTHLIPVWRKMEALRAVQLNDRAAEDLELYYSGLRDDHGIIGQNVGGLSMNTVLRNEYPRPDLVRKEWLSLNGTWQFAFATSQTEDLTCCPDRFDREITVPFVFQSKLSGINRTEPHEVVWYRREFTVPSSWSGKRILLHFGAVDYESVVWVNGKFAGMNKGGYVPFTLDITSLLEDDRNELIVKVIDEDRTDQPKGKQSANLDNWGCWYTRSTGIWQSVWLEPVAEVHVQQLRIIPDVDREAVQIECEFSQVVSSLTVDFAVEFEGQRIVSVSRPVPIKYSTYSDLTPCRNSKVTIAVPDPNLWSPEDPNLYDLTIRLYEQDRLLDEVRTYFGMRKIEVRDNRIYLNDKPYYLRMVLDQGYWPDGIYTPRTVEAFEEDIKFIKAAGFNGVRKHQKIEDPYFYYYCDRYGLLVWAEMPSCYVYHEMAALNLIREWQRAIRRLYNFPCIMAWVPINESWGVEQLRSSEAKEPRALHYLNALYYVTKALDHTRLVVSNDGWQNATTDIISIHEYTQDAEDFSRRYEQFKQDRHSKAFSHGLPILLSGYEYTGQPIMITEYGGVKADEQGQEGWGYGTSARSFDDMLQRMKELTEAIRNQDEVCGFCYTQLTDVEQEVNGLMTFDRKPKLPAERYAEVFGE